MSFVEIAPGWKLDPARDSIFHESSPTLTYSIDQLRVSHPNVLVDLYESRVAGWYLDVSANLLALGSGNHFAALQICSPYLELSQSVRTAKSSDRVYRDHAIAQSTGVEYQTAEDLFVDACARLFETSPIAANRPLWVGVYKSVRCGLCHCCMTGTAAPLKPKQVSGGTFNFSRVTVSVGPASSPWSTLTLHTTQTQPVAANPPVSSGSYNVSGSFALPASTQAPGVAATTPAVFFSFKTGLSEFVGGSCERMGPFEFNYINNEVLHIHVDVTNLVRELQKDLVDFCAVLRADLRPNTGGVFDTFSKVFVAY